MHKLTTDALNCIKRNMPRQQTHARSHHNQFMTRSAKIEINSATD